MTQGFQLPAFGSIGPPDCARAGNTTHTDDTRANSTFRAIMCASLDFVVSRGSGETTTRAVSGHELMFVAVRKYLNQDREDGSGNRKRGPAISSRPCSGSVFRSELVLQTKLLHAPIHQLSDIQGVRIAAVDFVDHAELLELMSGAAELAERCPVQLQLVDLAVEEGILGWIRVGAVEILMRARRDADRTRGADVLDLALERAVVVEHLNALITHVGDVDIAARIDGDGVRNIELAL